MQTMWHLLSEGTEKKSQLHFKQQYILAMPNPRQYYPVHILLALTWDILVSRNNHSQYESLSCITEWICICKTAPRLTLKHNTSSMHSAKFQPPQLPLHWAEAVIASLLNFTVNDNTNTVWKISCLGQGGELNHSAVHSISEPRTQLVQ